MGREIVFEIKKKGSNDVLFEDFVCGRNDATDRVAFAIRNSVKCKDGCSVAFNAKSSGYSVSWDSEDADWLISELNHVIEEEDTEIRRLLDEQVDLREARRHAASLDRFEEFTGRIREISYSLEAFEHSSAATMLKILDDCRSRIRKASAEESVPPEDYVLVVSVSE